MTSRLAVSLVLMLSCWVQAEPASPSATQESFEASVRSWHGHINAELNQIPQVDARETSFALLKKGPTRRVVVMIHGLSDSPATMRDLAQVYADFGFNVLAVRLRGHGTNLNDFKINGTSKNWQADVHEAITVASGLGEQVSLVGYSTGGALAINYALKDILHRKSVHIHDINLIAPLFDFTKFYIGAEALGAAALDKTLHTQHGSPKKSPNIYSYTDTPAEPIAQATLLLMANATLKDEVYAARFVSRSKPISLNFILDSADTTINNRAAELFEKRAALFGFSCEMSNPIKTTTPHGLFTMKNLESAPNVAASEKFGTAIPVNPAFQEIIARTQLFITQTN